MPQTAVRPSRVSATPPEVLSTFPIRFPQTDYGDDQHEEWCEVYLHGTWHRFRLHDYAAIYNIPGLYEHLFYQTLQCSSPTQVVSLLADALRDVGECGTRLRVLDLGAGNGMVGDELRKLGVAQLSGVDIIPEALVATHRDRPGLYDQYLISDMCAPSPSDISGLRESKFNTLVTVAALGFGDIPPQAFANSFNLVENSGWLAFNLKETFFNGADDSGFFRLIRSMWDEEVVQMQSYRRYCHRLSISGKPLYYVAMVARKKRDIPRFLVERAMEP